VAVMYAGRIVEQGSVADVLDRPQHPYTQGLIDSLPSRNKRGQRLRQIPGMAPDLLSMPVGCAFAARCARAAQACVQDSEPREILSGHTVRCFLSRSWRRCPVIRFPSSSCIRSARPLASR
ncbi:hypothetical protein CVE36_04210, partial [Pseudomonas syringae pv. actinidiae]|nr:hypothetical protein [Pseudomonas syringae pv. actinidiae]